ncbi:hypothetical protein I553_9058 [Mycobacterium xenopi 4042]|uniref:Uncharacterized protein n=1 Tax=Mycobacterium xenopi 4042 TaxID=1299334 RepID=X8AQ32_MYCXE|nr:hypothetical protein I553_9058 [Mycobacterium xenopi 4042]
MPIGAPVATMVVSTSSTTTGPGKNVMPATSETHNDPFSHALFK